MDYKGYRIVVYWKDKDLGYHYAVYDQHGKEVLHSNEAYFYEENAQKAAVDEIDNLD